MPSRPGAKSRLDSWPPTLVRLSPTTPKEYPALDDIDDDPLTYFLTPAPDLEDGGDVAMMDFDAGIESPGRSDDGVRSVSPSSLDGLARPIPRARRARSPPLPDLADIATPDSDEDEAYIRFAPSWGKMAARSKARPSLKQGPRLTAEALLSASSAAAGTRGRSRASSSGRGRQQQAAAAAAAAAAARRRGNQAWREPSPDVWSIEEETEEEMLSEMGSSVAARSDAGERGEVVHGKAAKPKKRVRFVLPAEEM